MDEEMSVEELEEELIEKQKELAQVELNLEEEESKGGLLRDEIEELENELKYREWRRRKEVNCANK